MAYKDLAFGSLLRYDFTINTTGTEYCRAIHICTKSAEIQQQKKNKKTPNKNTKTKVCVFFLQAMFKINKTSNNDKKYIVCLHHA